MSTMQRRSFLKNLGRAAALPIALPYLPSLSREARAAGSPPRLLLIFTANGTVENQFWPTGGETDFTFAKGSITEPLAPFRSKLIFPRGLRRLTSGSGAHEKNMGGLWTGSGLVATNGYPTSASVDQIIAQKLATTAPFKSLQFGVQCDSFNRGGNKAVLKSMTYSGRNAVVSPEDDPNLMFNKLMIGKADATPGMSTGDIEKIRAKKKSVLDAVRGDLQALMNRIDRDDRSRLEQHLESVVGIEKRLIEPLPTSVGCTMPAMPPANLTNVDARKANENFPAILAVQNKLAIAALACGRTQVATVQWSRSFSPIVHTWVGVNEDHHTLSHKTGAQQINQLHALNRWYGERFGELLAGLDAVKEPDGTLLDNTIVVWGNEAATGLHDAGRMPAIVAGKGAGRLNTGANGRLLNLATYDWSQLLVTLCHAMGVTDVSKVGELPMKTGDIPTMLA